MMEWWQHIPEHINPIVFTVGFFSVHWYALFWLVGCVAPLVWVCSSRNVFSGVSLSQEDWFDLFLLLFFGAFLGGHLGYALLYRPDFLLADPIGFFLPYQRGAGVWQGIAGMSFHGGLLGVAGVIFLFTRKKRISFWLVADSVALVAPIALFFGRLGNFFALELYGRVTVSAWGMYFPRIQNELQLRHPSTLYEALGEGLLLFVILFFLRQRLRFRGQLAAVFLAGYGVIRFCIEYVREPDQGLGFVFGVFTRGQLFSLPLIVSGTLLFLWLREKNHGKIKG